MRLLSPLQAMEFQLKELKMLEDKKYESDENWLKYWNLRDKLDNNPLYRKKMDDIFYKINKHLKKIKK